MAILLDFEDEDKFRSFLERRINLGQKSNFIRPYSGHSVYDDKAGDNANHPKFQKIPKSLYLYRFAFDLKGRMKIDRYYYRKDDKTEIGYDEVPGIIESLADDARNGAIPEQRDIDLDGQLWNKLSYFCMIFDDDNWGFLNFDGSTGAIMFIDEGKYRKNRTFYDGTDLPVTLTAADGSKDVRSAFYMVNYMKDDNGDDLVKMPPGQDPTYKFDILMLARLTSNRLKIMKFDPTGTNEGPPLPPQ